MDGAKNGWAGYRYRGRILLLLPWHAVSLSRLGGEGEFLAHGGDSKMHALSEYRLVNTGLVSPPLPAMLIPIYRSDNR